VEKEKQKKKKAREKKKALFLPILLPMLLTVQA